jgi:hypothetical protein
MKSWQFAVVGLACLAVAGCQTDPNIVLLERELRLQEDELYRLREVVEDYQTALRSCREDALPPGRPERAAPESAGIPTLPELEGVPRAEEETSPPPEGAEYGDRQSEAPPSPYQMPSDLPPRDGGTDGPSEDLPMQDPGDFQLPIPDSSGDTGLGDGTEVRPTGCTEPIIPADSRRVVRLGLDRLLTGGYDTDGRPGDDGITVGLELRNALEQRVDAAADVSVVLLDPALAADAARVARWDFAAAEMAADFQGTGPGRAIQLEMPWPADPPVHNQLYLFVRYTTSDGRNLQAEGPIRIALPGETSRRWVPAKPAAPQPEVSYSTDLGALDQAELRQGHLTPAVRMPGSQSAAAVAEPAEPKIECPVWSPHRP